MLRVTAILFALAAMILGSVSGPFPMAHAAAHQASVGCDHDGTVLGEISPSQHGCDGCDNGLGGCMDGSGRCLSACAGSAVVPVAVLSLGIDLPHGNPSTPAVAVAHGRNIAPLLDPPRSTV